MFGLTCFSVTGFSCSIRCDCLPDGAVLYYCCVSTFPCEFSSVGCRGIVLGVVAVTLGVGYHM
jgi:hypothetical protein